MKVLVIGNGGREHALAWKIAQSPRVSRVLVSPGNGGTAGADGIINLPGTSVEEWLDIARTEQVQMTVVGPEGPLAAGVVDAFRAAGLRIFGPTRAAAQLEGSKDFAKAFMRRHHIPTATASTFTEAAAAHAYINARPAPIVVKADGLAAGKGVVVATTRDEAHQAVDDMLGGSLGGAGARVLIEQFVQGEEASFIVMVDGRHVLALATSQDHKRLLAGDQGPNTGGMGAYSPAPVVTPELHRRIMRDVILPAVQGMAQEGTPYTGFLYAGVMIAADGTPYTLEFNCRMGDPETQPILMRLKSDFTVLLDHAINGTLDQVEADWDRRSSVGIVLAAAGYPQAPRTGDVIEGLPAQALEDACVFHAGTAQVDGVLRTAGGRVLCVTALGDSLRQAKTRAQDLADGIRFDGMQLRSDIGWRALAPARRH